MMQRDEMKLVVTVIAIILILTLLYVYRENMKPSRIELAEISEHVGEYVEVQGTVVYTRDYEHGMYIEIAKNGSRVSAYLDTKIKLVPGNLVNLRGIVEYRLGKYVLEVSNGGIIIHGILKPNIQNILQNPQNFVGLNMQIRGNLTMAEKMVTKHYIRVSDGVHDAWIYVPVPYYGERDIYIIGTVKYGILHSEKIALNKNPNITLISIPNIPNFEGENVQIHGYVLNYSRILGYAAYIVDGDYHLKVILPRPLAMGYAVLNGTFEYLSTYGEYALICT